MFGECHAHVIMDAKNYKKDSFPDSSSILKQIAYGDSVYHKLSEKKGQKIIFGGKKYEMSLV